MFDFRKALTFVLTPRRPSRATRGLVVGLLALHLALALWLGWPQPGPTRWWDERFNVQNIESILKTQSIQPANAYYGGVSYLPQAAALLFLHKTHTASGWPSEVLDQNHHLSPFSYHILRASQALWGTLALLLLFLLARRLMEPRIALLAMTLTVLTTRFSHASAIFKPDIELVATTLLALILCHRAAVAPASTFRYLLAGAAIGLAVGSKLNGVAIVFPLLVATGFRWRERGRWLRVLGAGVSSFLIFWCFNPALVRVFRALERNRTHYENTASGGLLDIVGQVFFYPFESNFHGPWIASLGLLGIVLLGRWLVGRDVGHDSDSNDRWIAWWMLLSYPVAYYVLYLLASPRAKANHFLQIVPFVALFASVAIGVIAFTAFATQRRWLRYGFPFLLSLLLVPPMYRNLAWIYEQTTPLTWDLAQEWIEQTLPDPTRAYIVATDDPYRRGLRPGAPAYSLSNPARPRQDVDSVLFSLTTLEQTRGDEAARWSRLERDGQHREYHPRFLEARGPSVFAAVRPRRLVDHSGSRRIVFRRQDDGTLMAQLPPDLEGHAISFRLRLGLGDRWVPKLRLQGGGESYRFVLGPASGGDLFVSSPRFTPPEDRRLTVSVDGGLFREKANGELFVWTERSSVSSGEPL